MKNCGPTAPPKPPVKPTAQSLKVIVPRKHVRRAIAPRLAQGIGR